MSLEYTMKHLHMSDILTVLYILQEAPTFKKLGDKRLVDLSSFSICNKYYCKGTLKKTL